MSRVVEKRLVQTTEEPAGKSVEDDTLPPDPRTVNIAVVRHFKKEHGFDAGAHSSARAIKALDEAAWASFFKFVIVRNPWSHAVSDYHWRDPEGRIGFKEFLRRVDDPDHPDPERIAPPLRSNWSVYTIDDHIEADFIGRYETLEKDLEVVSRILGFDASPASYSAKAGINPRAPLRDYYDDEAIELIRAIYAKEIDQFGYVIPF